jgi:hypothetical protein
MTFAGRRETIHDNDEYFEYSTPQVRMLVRQIDMRIGGTVPLEEWEML